MVKPNEEKCLQCRADTHVGKKKKKTKGKNRQKDLPFVSQQIHKCNYVKRLARKSRPKSPESTYENESHRQLRKVH